MQKKAPETTKPVPVEIDFSAYRIGNPEEFSRNMLKLMEDGSKVALPPPMCSDSGPM